MLSSVCAKTSEQICMTFSGKVGNGPMNKQLNFGADPDFLDSSLLGNTESGERT